MTKKTTTKKKASAAKAKAKPMPASLVALAARIDEKAKLEAVSIFEQTLQRLNNIKAQTGVSSEVLSETLSWLDKKPEEDVVLSSVIIEFAREKIINALLSQ